MKILLVSFFFPPINNTGARRVGGTAKHLALLGHDMRVVTCRSRIRPDAPDDALPVDQILRTLWVGPPIPAQAERYTREPPTVAVRSRQVAAYRTRSALRALYRRCAYLPDPYVGWYPFAVRKATRWLGHWRPDMVLSSAYPLTGIAVGHRLADHYAVPHVIEMRDLWTDNAYRPRPSWAQPIDRRLEHRFLSRAAGLVTVSDELARILRGKYSAPVITIYHGFEHRERSVSTRAAGDPELRLIYTGCLHDGRRDPLPLFRSLVRLQSEGVSIGFDYYGPDSEVVLRRAAEAGSPSHVRALGMVPNAQALQAQADADALVLLMWNHPNEAGSVTGKLFEYIGAAKPILVIGAPHSAAGKLVTRERLGFAPSTDDETVDWLRAVAAAKREGRLAPLDIGSIRGFSRQEQTRRLSEFLETCAQNTTA